MKTTISYYHPPIDTCRLILMFCVCLNLFGVPTAFGGIIQVLLNFAPCAFFIFSGFLVLSREQGRGTRIVNAIRRSGITFAAMFVGNLALNLIFETETTLLMLSSKRFWFDFIVFNNWNLPIGRPMWFVQAIFYAYIFIYILYRFKLLRYDWIFIAIFFIIAVLTGELSGLIHFNFLGESFIPGNFFTRAIPYILIGHRLRILEPILVDASFEAWWVIAISLALMVGECFLLNHFNAFTYYGHLIGMAPLSIALCIGVVTRITDDETSLPMLSFRHNARLITYYLCSPVYYFLTMMLNGLQESVANQIAPYMGIAVIVICLTISVIYEVAVFAFWSIKDRKSNLQIDSENSEDIIDNL